MKLSWSEAESKAQDRAEWRSIVSGLCSGRSWKAKKKKKKKCKVVSFHLGRSVSGNFLQPYCQT